MTHLTLDKPNGVMTQPSLWIVGVQLESEEGRVYTVVASDLTHKGMRVFSRERLLPRSRVMIKMSLSNDKWPLYCHGLIEWCANSNEFEEWPIVAGIEFRNLSMDDEARIFIFSRSRNNQRSTKGIESRFHLNGSKGN